jgi:hypothetical protein
LLIKIIDKFDRHFSKSYARKLLCNIKLGKLDEANAVKQEMTTIFDVATLNSFGEFFSMLFRANEAADKERRKMMKGFAQSDGIKKKEPEPEPEEIVDAVAKPVKRSKWLSFLLGSMLTLVGGFTIYFVMKNRNRYFK